MRRFERIKPNQMGFFKSKGTGSALDIGHFGFLAPQLNTLCCLSEFNGARRITRMTRFFVVFFPFRKKGKKTIRLSAEAIQLSCLGHDICAFHQLL